eukprot:CAMPEP_0119413080 /NCGR_PEP_ID=MMETSP1335-20130426/5282_1 /TAXON_ID=259385 /ORGANISM="Chrysoculter rhomboideus, Strain RCC1486" /LENGTH=781 /DNA_ID=CAMNT_0007437859 /DNA_START=54 /DNA_END=2395 /DNA_ORIENTATION=-
MAAIRAVLVLLAAACGCSAELIAHYEFEDSLAATTGGAPATGTSSFSAAKVAKGADIDSSASSFITVPSSVVSAIEGTAPRSIVFWIKLTQPAVQGTQQILIMGDDSTSSGYYHVLAYRAADDASIWFLTGPDATNFIGGVGPTLTYDTWAHLAITSEGGTTSVYIDSVLAFSDAIAVNTTVGTDLQIGAPYPGTARTYLESLYGTGSGVEDADTVATVDELGVYSAALQQFEVDAVYAAGEGSLTLQTPSPSSPPAPPPPPPPSPPAPPPETEPLVLHLKLNGDASDSSYKGVDGVVSGTEAYEAGQHGQALVFDGTTTFVTVPLDVTRVQGSNPRTLVLWFKITGDANTFAPLLAYGDTVQLAVSTGALAFGRADVDPNAGGDQYSEGGTLSSGVWYHAAAVYDPTAASDAGEWAIYLDGARVATDDRALPTTSAALTVGAGESTALFSGVIDDVGLFAAAKSAAEIDLIANATITGNDLSGAAPLAAAANATAEPAAHAATHATPPATASATAEPAASASATIVAAAVTAPAATRCDRAPLDARRAAADDSGNNAHLYAKDAAGANRTAFEGAAAATDGFGFAEAAECKVGRCVRFDANLQLEDGTSPTTGSDSRSVALWFRQEGASVSGAGLLSYGVDAGTDLFELHLLGGKVCVDVTSTSLCGTTTYAVDTWTHVAATYRVGTQLLAIYVDGVLDAQQTLSTPLATDAGGLVRVGSGVQPIAPAFVGYIDDVGLWERDLTDAQISTIITNAGTQVNQAGDSLSPPPPLPPPSPPPP